MLYQIAKDRNEVSKGYAIVEFQSKSKADMCVKEIHNSFLNERLVSFFFNLTVLIFCNFI